MEGLSINQVARLSNVRIETVRYYEKRGLIAKPPRSDSGYRMFTHQAVEDIQFIKRAQDIGFSLKEIEIILTLNKSEECLPSENMYKLAQTKLLQLEESINQLNHFKALMEEVLRRPTTKIPLSKSECPILQQCSKGDA